MASVGELYFWIATTKMVPFLNYTFGIEFGMRQNSIWDHVIQYSFRVMNFHGIPYSPNCKKLKSIWETFAT
jgi:hypothetical protein